MVPRGDRKSAKPRSDNAAALDLLTVDEVASMLKTSRKAIYHRISRGQIPSVRLGRSVFIRRSDLAACLVPGAFNDP
ncbi:helix-turn-helix domain-containing protein [Nannocystis pusilla]|uniref:Helix-turn-helix domain-containing protein n=1 Tax=Nannocystis pusilla TaxID=889268 RepID=A0ABS7TXB6_9BACT|nr:helix-turn-helix domain-containing protein [Nannocystis pusilla]MBZ5712666.1 helix-turn-helix domain-containing protein [Nannocystis pusilla]